VLVLRVGREDEALRARISPTVAADRIAVIATAAASEAQIIATVRKWLGAYLALPEPHA